LFATFRARRAAAHALGCAVAVASGCARRAAARALAVAPVALAVLAAAPATAAPTGSGALGRRIGTPAVRVAGLPVPLPKVVAAVARATAPCHGASVSSPARARAGALCLVNAARAAVGVRRLRNDSRLKRAATAQAHDMSRRHYFAHQRPGGPSLRARLRARGFRAGRVGEAIAWGCGTLSTPAATVRAWLASPPHRAIVLARAFTRVGIGFARGGPVACAGGAVWVLDAGAG
jgi:uncharacterized protein YkwD